MLPLLVRLMLFVVTQPFLDFAPDPAGLELGSASFAGITSRYGGAGDSRWGGQALACAPDVHIHGTMHVCAHRTLPCGTVLVIESVRTGQRTICRVMDRGPYGAMHEGAWRVKIHDGDAGAWRGVLDLSPAAFADLGLRGLSPVKAWIVVRPTRRLYIRPKRRRHVSV